MVLVIASVTAMALYDEAPGQLRSMLKIKELPVSATNIKCTGPFVITDALVTCGFEIEPNDMASMLAGWRFSGEKARRNSRSVDYIDNDLRSEFTPFNANYIYRANDDQFEPAGGHLFVVIDKDRRNALVDLYIE
jgi:hypothetical protein